MFFLFTVLVFMSVLGASVILLSSAEKLSKSLLPFGITLLAVCPIAAHETFEELTKPEPERFSVVIEEPKEDVPLGTPLPPVTEDLTLHIPSTMEGRSVTGITSGGTYGLVLHFEGSSFPNTVRVPWEDVGKIHIMPQN